LDLELTDKVAIVTGGNHGIGRAVARQLAKEGVDDVAVPTRNFLGEGLNRNVAGHLAPQSPRAIWPSRGARLAGRCHGITAAVPKWWSSDGPLLSFQSPRPRSPPAKSAARRRQSCHTGADYARAKAALDTRAKTPQGLQKLTERPVEF
jgi:short chain dehydrogenase